MNFFHFASMVCALGGAIIAGGVLADYGAAAAILGAIAGLVAGWFVGPLLVLALFFVVVLVEEGPRSAFDFLRRRRKGDR